MRVFVALALPDTARDALSDLQDTIPPGLGRPVDWDAFHLTLAFAGEQPAATVEAMRDALATVRSPCFDLHLKGTGQLGDAPAGVLHAGVAATPGLTALHARIHGHLAGAGLALPRRRFRPHVTLARMPRRMPPDATAALGHWLERSAGFHHGPVAVSRFTLYRSHLHPDGAIHETLADWPLTSD